MSGQYGLLLMIAGMHVIGLAGIALLLYLALRRDSGPQHWPGERGDDGWGNEPRQPPKPSDRPWGGVPLPDADQPLIRLRDHRKLGDLLPGRERRPAREPAPTRTPDRTPA